VLNDRHLIVFSQTAGKYSDNARALFEYCIKNDTEFRVIWLYQGSLNMLNDHHLSIPTSSFIRMYSLKGAFVSLRAKYFVVSHGTGDMGLYKSSAKKVINVWHGTPIKGIGLYEKFSNKRFISNEISYYDTFVTASHVEASCMISAWGIDHNKVVITGLPRNDCFFTSSRNIEPKILDKLGVKGKKLVLYSPTFRDNGCSVDFFPYHDNKLDPLVKILKSNNAVILMRPHQNDKKSISKLKKIVSEHPDVFFLLDQYTLSDINQITNYLDVLITDYSSIYLDTLLNNVPVIFIPYDYSSYTIDRDFIYDYDAVTPGPKVINKVEFENALLDALETGGIIWKAHRNWVNRMFHHYLHGGACERVIDKIRTL